MTLIQRIEQATEEQQRELLICAYAAVFGKDPGWDQWYSEEVEVRHRGRWFLNMLDAQAYESAAMMFVPEGWTLATMNVPGERPKAAMEKGTRQIAFEEAALSLAIAAACVRAMEDDHAE